jgi:hypothetical protein
MIRPTFLTTNFTSMHALALCAALSSGCHAAGTPHWTEPTETASGGDDGAAFERSVVREGSGHHSRSLAIGLGLAIGIPVTLGVVPAVALGALAKRGCEHRNRHRILPLFRRRRRRQLWIRDVVIRPPAGVITARRTRRVP